MEDNILAYVMSRLPEQGSHHYLERLQRIADGATVPVDTLIKIAKGVTTNPRIATVQRLHDYFKALEQREAA